MAVITTLDARQPSHRSIYDRFQEEVMACAQQVTVVCGAGISTKAGLRDFRSPDGIYNAPLGDGRKILGSELFASSTLRDPQKLREFSRILTEMRIQARQAALPDCHKWIAELYRLGRLVRCYTQNVDGLQTRDFDDLHDVVVELHGTNVYLRCHKCRQRPREPPSAFDQQLLEDGSATCTLCSIQPERTGSDMVLRARVPGILLPEVLLNEDSCSPSKEGKTLEAMKEDDSHCDLLLVLGTSLRSHGAASLVRDLANLVHAQGGMVIYINLTSLSPSSWSSYVDLHIRVDVEEWASENLAQLHHGSQDRNVVLRSDIALR
ncbi:SIR2 family transcriptional regulator, partial [Rhizoctonia solani 123E]